MNVTAYIFTVRTNGELLPFEDLTFVPERQYSIVTCFRHFAIFCKCGNKIHGLLPCLRSLCYFYCTLALFYQVHT